MNENPNRRHFLNTLGAGAAGVALSGIGEAAVRLQPKEKTEKFKDVEDEILHHASIMLLDYQPDAAFVAHPEQSYRSLFFHHPADKDLGLVAEQDIELRIVEVDGRPDRAILRSVKGGTFVAIWENDGNKENFIFSRAKIMDRIAEFWIIFNQTLNKPYPPMKYEVAPPK